MTIKDTERPDTARTQTKAKLTDAIAKTAQTVSGKTRIIYDAGQKGFGLRVTGRGAKAFVLNYVIDGRERRLTIGPFPEWSTAAARLEAANLRRMVNTGRDPLGEREASRVAPTVRDLWARYAAEHTAQKSASSQRNERSIWIRLILPALGPLKVGDLTFSDCARLHADVSRATPTQANRVMALLRHALNVAIRWSWIERNPSVGVHRNPEIGRERYLTTVELRRFVACLDDQLSRSSVQALKFILLTGCRRGEALGATWDQIDLQEGVWTKPPAQTKQRRRHRIPLSRGCLELLELAKGRSPTIVFPGRTGSPLVELKKVFGEICRDAGISSLRIHDLRHTYASYLASDGVELATVAKLLGHSQLSTKLRYAHLFDERLREATNIMASAIGQVENG